MLNRGGVIRRIEGRKSSFLTGKDGSRYSGALLTRVFKDITTIDEAQFVQYHKGVVTLRYVVGKDFKLNDLQALKESVTNQLGEHNFDLTIEQTEREGLIRSKRGKFSYVEVIGE